MPFFIKYYYIIGKTSILVIDLNFKQSIIGYPFFLCWKEFHGLTVLNVDVDSPTVLVKSN